MPTLAEWGNSNRRGKVTSSRLYRAPVVGAEGVKCSKRPDFYSLDLILWEGF